MGLPSARASDKRLMTTMPAPSPRAYPLARASKALQRASGDKNPALERVIVVSGRSITLAPPASATRASPLQTLAQAWWNATSEEEHAVSRLTLGPRRSKKYDRRSDRSVSETPFALAESMAARLSGLPTIAIMSTRKPPTNTAVGDP